MGALIQTTGPLDWAVAAQPIDGERQCGDQSVVVAFPGGVLVGVIDGAGHGPLAEEAALRAVRTLAARPELPVDELIRRCHAALRDTRGAVISLVSVRWHVASWIGVGNVEGGVIRAAGGAPEALLLRAGIVGQHLPALLPSPVRLGPGDSLVLVTDGVRHGFDEEVRRFPGLPVGMLASAILASHRRGTDDALVLVARMRIEGG